VADHLEVSHDDVLRILDHDGPMNLCPTDADDRLVRANDELAIRGKGPVHVDDGGRGASHCGLENRRIGHDDGLGAATARGPARFGGPTGEGGRGWLAAPSEVDPTGP